MRGKINKKIAMLVVIVLTLGIGGPNNQVSAYTMVGETITLDSATSEQLIVSDASTYNYVIPYGCELIIADGGSVSGEITVDGGKLTIQEGGIVDSITGINGTIDNSGIIRGDMLGDTLYMTIGVFTNYESGIVQGDVYSGTNVTLENYGTINGDVYFNYSYGIKNYGYMNAVSVIFCTFENYGSIGSCSFPADAGSCGIIMGENSSIASFNCPKLNDGFLVKINVENGATVKSAVIDTDSLDDSALSGVLTISNSLVLSGTSPIQSKLNIGVAESTIITKNSIYDGWYVHYGDDNYRLPASKFEGKTMTDMYNLTMSKTSIDILDLEVAYGTEDITASAQSFAVANPGMCDMKFRITEIPSFAEVYNGTDKLSEGNVIALSGGSDITLTVKAKNGNKAGEYSDNLSLEQWTDVGEALGDGVSIMEGDILVSTDSFPITLKVNRKKGEASVTVADIYYGGTISPVAVSATNGTDNVTYKYKVKGADDSTYTETKPTAAGDYVVQATFAQTAEYNQVTATDNFSILRRMGSGSITISDVYYGGTITPVVVSATNGTDNVTYKYKVKGAEDSTYTTVKPTEVGAYTICAIFAQTDEYEAVAVTSEFQIIYLPMPENPYSISGTQGKNNYYTSDVTITPAQGYLIANSLDGTYKQTLTVSKTTDVMTLYLKKISTGEKTGCIFVPTIKIDKDAPSINAVDGETKYGEQIELTVEDNDLEQVLVNWKIAEVQNNMAILTLSSNYGQETYEITCIDAAGNISKITVVVAADWMKNRTIPSGSKVRLSADLSYKLGGGTWQVEGDGTSYAGDVTFYVSKDGEYSFTKID
ncbi:MAG: hypothetical protein PUA62_02375 [Lachnospiraceae bacterium]|nr:hypothetical protein [Lachnospiraceae bacterium]